MVFHMIFSNAPSCGILPVLTGARQDRDDSGQMIQDIPTYFAGLSLDYAYEHRNEKVTPDSCRDYVPHDVQVAEDSILFGMVDS